jgi:hypothetical protein
MAEVVDPSILLADYQAKVERLIPASERGPGTGLPDASVARCELRSISLSAYSFVALIAVECVSTQMSLKSYSGVPGVRPPSGVLRALPRLVPTKINTVGPVLRRLQ